MSQKIAILGSGKAGSALQAALSRVGHEVRSPKRGQIVPTASWADVIILAVPFRAVPEVARELGTAADGKTVVDVTNALTPDFQLAIGFTTSGAEELQKVLPRANVVKAFNTVFAQHMSTGKVNGEVLTAFVAGDNGAARKTVPDPAGTGRAGSHLATWTRLGLRVHPGARVWQSPPALSVPAPPSGPRQRCRPRSRLK
jgi:predicted dinucleotide-binding enzyme